MLPVERTGRPKESNTNMLTPKWSRVRCVMLGSSSVSIRPARKDCEGEKRVYGLGEKRVCGVSHVKGTTGIAGATDRPTE